MKTFVIMVGLFFASISVNAQTQEYMDEVKKMMELSGADATVRQIISQITGSTGKEIPKDALQLIDKEVQACFDRMRVTMGQVYHKYLTLEDLKRLNSLYEDKTFRKLMKVQPEMQKEMMPDIQKVSVEIAQKVIEILKENNGGGKRIPT